MKNIPIFVYQNFFYDHVTWIKTVVIFSLVIWIIKKIFFMYSMHYNNKCIRLISSFKIDANNKIVILEIQDVKLVLGVTLRSINVLYTFPVVRNVVYKNVKSDISVYNISYFNKKLYQLFIFIIFFLYSSTVYAADFSQLTQHIFFNNIYHWSFSTQVILITCSITLLSFFVLMTTSFTRIIIVLSLLRNALGVPSLPPNKLLISISLCLTCFIMYPTYYRVYQEAYLPFYTHQILMKDAIMKSIQPIYDFMIHQTRQSDLLSFSKLFNIQLFPDKMIPIQLLLISFITSELKTAFQIGFTIFIPFLVIDLFVASILMSLGMMMLTPNTISLPIKLILFVIVDGWKLIFSSLVHSFY
ncbi:flagellar type III secretion system pore protein FliP [Buchnera aphidicola]|uniref:Flagellar biosynthetic protein FliP n=1 Tax=Buchnera aphidicola (Sarucallis kahawaluokalani) TaxID=1241878 RepID=A0A4D6YHP7_9GAMM|nr:flagellar type III secretion system pore protein FliP [Buchnera aphidicola]QCI25861.1 flagellar biosynthetic protein FliP [Buchnera aphidicola (Sarucallis kahawaluokalani)]